MTRILVSSATGLNNSGDEAILQSMLQSFKNIKDLKVSVFSFNPIITKKIHNINTYSHSIFKHPIDTLREINLCDIFILGGGGLLQDETSLFNIPFWLSKLIIAWIYKKRIYIYANSIGPVKYSANQILIKFALNKVNNITVRDYVSKNLLIKWGIKRNKIKVTADAVFNLRLSEKPINTSLLNNISKDKYIVFSLRHWFDQFPLIPVKIATRYNLKTSKNKKKWNNLIYELSETVSYINKELNLDVVFISLCPGRDKKIPEIIINRNSSKKNILIDELLHPSDIIYLIKNSVLTIGMRLHSLIYSIIAKKPFISLSYSLKNKSFLSSIDMEKYGISIDHLSANKLKKMINRIIANKKSISEDLDNIYNKCQIRSSSNIIPILNMLDYKQRN